jgi:hypothetical protein
MQAESELPEFLCVEEVADLPKHVFAPQITERDDLQ